MLLVIVSNFQLHYSFQAGCCTKVRSCRSCARKIFKHHNPGQPSESIHLVSDACCICDSLIYCKLWFLVFLFSIKNDIEVNIYIQNHSILFAQNRWSYTANVYRALRGVCRFSLQYLWKRTVRITKKPYTPQRERLCIL